MIKSFLISATAPLVIFMMLAGAAPLQAAQLVYEYKVMHPQYGDVGTYTNIIEQSGGRTNVRTSINVAVKFLGIVVYRQEAQRQETWSSGRLAEFQGTTIINGNRTDVRGETQGDTFVVSGPKGTFVAPADVHPSNPWSAKLLEGDIMMSTVSGRLFRPEVRRSEETLSLDGTAERLRRLDIFSDKHEVVWLNSNDVPVAFRAEEDGTPVDFVLIRRPGQQLSAANPF
jgi:hypothetical protein